MKEAKLSNTLGIVNFDTVHPRSWFHQYV